jgi:hypothetical protein
MDVALGKLPLNKHVRWNWNFHLLHGHETDLMECEVAEEEVEDSVPGRVKRSSREL